MHSKRSSTKNVCAFCMAEHKLERELRRFFFALAPIFVRPECRKSSHSGTGILATQAMVNQNIDSFNFFIIFRTSWLVSAAVCLADSSASVGSSLHNFAVLSYLLLTYFKIGKKRVLLKINLKFKLCDISWKGERWIEEGHSIASAPCKHVLEAECPV